MTVQTLVETENSSLQPLLFRLRHEDSGQDLIEYGLIAALLGLSTVAGVHGLANSIIGDINFIVNSFSNATG